MHAVRLQPYTGRHAPNLDQYRAGVSHRQTFQVVAYLAPAFPRCRDLGLHHLHARVGHLESGSGWCCPGPRRRTGNHACRLVRTLCLGFRVAAQESYSVSARRRSAGVGAVFSRRRSAWLSACISRTRSASICFKRSGLFIVSAASLFKAETLRCVSLSAS